MRLFFVIFAAIKLGLKVRATYVRLEEKLDI